MPDTDKQEQEVGQEQGQGQQLGPKQGRGQEPQGQPHTASNDRLSAYSLVELYRNGTGLPLALHAAWNHHTPVEINYILKAAFEF
jgi:hypothetical protein